MKSGINKLAKVLTVSIDKEKVTVFTEKETLLSTNNNINAYLKLYEALEGQEADIYILDHWGTNIIILEQFSTFPLVAHIYGQSKSDHDALVQLFNYCGRNDFHVSYRPSKDEFYVKAQFVGKKTLEDYII